MNKCISYIFLLLTFCMSFVYADEPMPRFEDFPAKIYQGKVVAVKIQSAKDREFKSRLRELSGKKPNFAGRYTLASWGCGASCVMSVAIDAETGKTIWLPFTVCCWDVDVDEPIKFKADSRLIEIQGSRNESGGGKYYYALNGDAFVLVKAIEKRGK